jgi:2'-5' RNA ligase
MRLFVAIEFPEEVKRGLQMIQQAEAQRRHGFRWTRPAQLHVTIKFVGEVEEARVESAWRALEALPRLGAITLGFAGVNTLPKSGRPRVLALELKGDLERLRALYTALENSFEQHGFPRETRVLHPHVTIARRDPRSPLGSAGLYFEKPWDGLVVVNEVSLIRSRLKSSGAEYETMATFPIS